MNKPRLLELCREQQSGEGGVITTEAFTSVLHTMGAPLESEGLTSLLAIYDKKGEGVMNYDDFISEQKFIHAVSNAECGLVHMYLKYGHLCSNTKLVQVMTSKQRRSVEFIHN